MSGEQLQLVNGNAIVGYTTWITGDVYDKADKASKLGGNPKRSMWEKRSWSKLRGVDVYRSNWRWPL